jgi:hypothetical protein
MGFMEPDGSPLPGHHVEDVAITLHALIQGLCALLNVGRNFVSLLPLWRNSKMLAQEVIAYEALDPLSCCSDILHLASESRPGTK